MQILFTDRAKKELNKLYSNRRLYLTDKSFCPSFIDYLRKISNDIRTLSERNVKYTVKHTYRYTQLTALAFLYKIYEDGVVLVYEIWYIGLPHLYKLCNYDRRVSNNKLGKRPLQITRGIISDYVQSNINGGNINGVTVHIVKRKGMTSRSNKPLFNYLFQGKLLSRYDVLNPTPFIQQQDGEVKAYADACNGRRYWLYPNGKWRIIKEATNNETKKIRLTETQFKRLLTECITKIINEIA